MSPSTDVASQSVPSSRPQAKRPVPALPRVRPVIPLAPSKGSKSSSLPKSHPAAGANSFPETNKNPPPPSTEAQPSRPSNSPEPIHMSNTRLTPASVASSNNEATVASPNESVAGQRSEDLTKVYTATTTPSNSTTLSPTTDTMAPPAQPLPFRQFPNHHPMMHNPNATISTIHANGVAFGPPPPRSDGSPRPFNGANGGPGSNFGGFQGSDKQTSPNGEQVIMSQLPFPFYNNFGNSGSMPPPPGFGVIPAYMSPPPVTHAQAWNVSANFVPPSMVHHAPHSSAGANGYVLSRSGSNSSSVPDIHGMPYSATKVGPFRPSQPDPFALCHYMSSWFSNREFADYALDVATIGGRSKFPSFPVHGIVIARSPTLGALMRAQRMSGNHTPDELRILTLEIDDAVTTPSAILDAVGFLYGLPLSNFMDQQFPPRLDLPSNVAQDRMVSALALAGAGKYLELAEVVAHGIDFALTSLTLETVAKALAFTQKHLTTFDGFDRPDPKVDFQRFLSMIQTEVLQQIELFLAKNLPAQFDFHPSAPELSEMPRLPIAIETRPSISDPRLASIQFGAMPTEQSTSRESDLLLSSILVSIPTPMLSNLLNSPIMGERIGWKKTTEIVREAIEERERRRTKVSKTKRVAPGATPLQWEETKFEERLESNPQSRSGLVLHRVHVEHHF